MRPFFFYILCGLMIGAGACQSTRPKSDATEAAANINPNLLPMFGKQAKTQAQLDADLKFLAYADQSFGSRPEASQFFTTRGWEYLNEGQPDTAMYRFNLAWLLDNTNPQAFWGFGALMAQKGNLPESIANLNQALTLEANNGVLMVDLASIHQAQYELLDPKKKKRSKDLDQASSLLQKAIELDSTNAYAYYKLSYNNFLLEDYDKAWENLHKSRALDLSVLDFAYLGQLMEKKEDPKGIFKSSQPEQVPEPEQVQEQEEKSQEQQQEKENEQEKEQEQEKEKEQQEK